ncbi:MAG: ATP synthase subunit I [Deltaproteobacteria bacterium]|nr:ATP synthase subunit I [Deltaproteobacteria bacterium]
MPQVKFDMLHPVLMKVGAANVVASAIAVGTSAVIASAFVVFSIIMGAVIGVINLSLLTRTIKNGFSFGPEKAQRFVIKRYYIRLLTTLVIIGILVSRNIAEPVGLIIGFSVIMMTTLAATIYFAKKELA